MISGDGPILYFSGRTARSKNANIVLVPYSRYHCVVKRQFISLSFQGLRSALTVNAIKNVCGGGAP